MIEIKRLAPEEQLDGVGGAMAADQDCTCFAAWDNEELLGGCAIRTVDGETVVLTYFGDDPAVLDGILRAALSFEMEAGAKTYRILPAHPRKGHPVPVVKIPLEGVLSDLFSSPCQG